MLNQFEIPAIKVQMFMAAEAEIRFLQANPTDIDDETDISRFASLWNHLTDVFASLRKYVLRRKNKTYQKSISAPEC